MSTIFDTMYKIFYIHINSITVKEEQNMSLLLKSTYLHIFTAIVIFATYAFWVFGVLGVEYFTGADALTRIGKSIGILIIAGYAFEILMTLTLLGKESIQKAKSGIDPIDEREKQILYKSLLNSHVVLCGGLFLSIAALAFGVEIFWVFNAIVFAFLLSVIAELGTKLFLFHAG